MDLKDITDTYRNTIGLSPIVDTSRQNHLLHVRYLVQLLGDNPKQIDYDSLQDHAIGDIIFIVTEGVNGRVLRKEVVEGKRK